MISHTNLMALWSQAVAILLISHIFIHFGNSMYNEEIIVSDLGCIKHCYGSLKIESSEPHEPMNNSEDRELIKVIQKFYSTSKNYRFYYQIMYVLGFMARFAVLLVVISVSYRLRGFINFVYILLSFLGIYKSIIRLASSNKIQSNNKLYSAMFWIKWFAFLNLLVDVLYQWPNPDLHSKEDELKSWQKQIGIYSFWRVNSDTAEVELVQINKIMSRFAMVAIILLYDNFQNSAEYKYWYDHTLKKFLYLSKIKAKCNAYYYNNKKLWKLGLNRYKKGIINQNVDIVNKNLDKWIEQYMETLNPDKYMKANMEKLIEQWQSKQNKSNEDSISDHDSFEDDSHNPTLKKRSISKSNKSLVKRQTTLPNDKEEDDELTKTALKNMLHTTEQLAYVEQEEAELERLQALNKLNNVEIMTEDSDSKMSNSNEKERIDNEKPQSRFTKLRKYIEDNYCNMFILMNELTRLNAIKTELERGRYKIYDAYEAKKLIEFYQDTDPEHPRIAELKKMVPTDNAGRHSILGLIISLICSNSQLLVYFFMIVAHIIDGTLLSLVYPLSIFCFAIVQEIRPRKMYWTFILIYTIIVLYLKAVARSYLVTEYLSENVIEFMKEYKYGLFTVSFSQFSILYYIFDVLILLFIIIHIIWLIVQGLWHKKEIEIESLFQAVQRITNAKLADPNKPHKKNKRKNSLAYKKDQLIELEESQNNPPDDNRGSIQIIPEVKQSVIKTDRDRVMNVLFYDSEKSSKKTNEIEKKAKNYNFKPGKDLYNYIAGTQFVILIYIILCFTLMERDYTNAQSSGYRIDQFSTFTIIAVFAHLIIIGIDRHIYLTKKFEVDVDNENSRQKMEDKFVSGLKIVLGQNKALLYNKLNMDIMISCQKSMRDEGYDTFSFLKQFEDLRNYDYGNLQFDNSVKTMKRYNSPIYLKFCLQIFLVCTVNFLVFWQLPARSHKATGDHYYCTVTNEENFEWNDPINNPFLIIFFLLYCLYFTFSALQIRHRYPELSSSSISSDKATAMNRSATLTFQAIPFLVELKVLTEWFETKTALGIFDWISFDIMYAELFCAKCLSYYGEPRKTQKVGMGSKFIMGFWGTLALMLIIAGPLIIFSTLNPVNTENPVISTNLRLSIIAANADATVSNTFDLYSTYHVNTMRKISDELYDQLELGKEIGTKQYSKSIIQEINMYRTSDTLWDITPPAQRELQNAIQRAMSGTITNLNIEMKMAFVRDEPPGTQTVTQINSVNILNLADSDLILKTLYNATTSFT